MESVEESLKKIKEKVDESIFKCIIFWDKVRN